VRTIASSTTPDPSSEEEGSRLHFIERPEQTDGARLAPLLFRGGAGGGEHS